jgi:hypothetical protein
MTVAPLSASAASMAACSSALCPLLMTGVGGMAGAAGFGASSSSALQVASAVASPSA